MTAPVARRPFMQDSIIWERKGPLPVWGWAAAVLLLALGYAWFRRGKADKAAASSATGGLKDELPGDQTAPTIFLLPVNSPGQVGSPNSMPKHRPRHVPPGTTPPPATVPEAPPAAGSPPPVATPAAQKPWIPDTVDVPANTNLYNFSQELENTYQGWQAEWTKGIFERIRSLDPGSIKWAQAGAFGSDPQYGNVPYYATAKTVRLW